MPRTTITIRLAAATEQQLRRSIHRRGHLVRLIETLLTEGLQDMSRFRPRRQRAAAAEVAKTTVRLERDLVARLDAAARQRGCTRAALIEAMVENMIETNRKARPPRPGCLNLHLDPLTEQQFRQRYVHRHGDVIRSVTDIVQAGLAALERFAAVKRRPPRRGRQQSTPLVIALDDGLLAPLTAAAEQIGASRAALLEAMIEARLKGEI